MGILPIHGVLHDTLAERGIPSKPYFPALHLFSYYRETFGYREGQFPVCEDVAARSIALPFFPEMTEGQVARVLEALRSVLVESVGTAAPRVVIRGR